MTGDPIATLRAYSNPRDAGPLLEAIAELERRARIEARRDAFLAKGGRLRHEFDGTYHGAALSLGARTWLGADSDYHTALEAALNAAGAP